MPYSTELTDDCLGIVHHSSGIVTGQELLHASIAARQLVQNTENFNYEVADFSGASEVRVAPEEMEEIVAQDRLAAAERPHAVIVIIAPGEQAYETARQWQEQVNDLGWTIHIAREPAEGYEWLSRHREQARRDLRAGQKETSPAE